MDNKALFDEIMLFKKQLEKETDNADRVLDILDSMANLKGVDMNLLRKTVIGKTLGRLKKGAKDGRVARRAREVIKLYQKQSGFKKSSSKQAPAAKVAPIKAEQPKKEPAATPKVPKVEPKVEKNPSNPYFQKAPNPNDYTGKEFTSSTLPPLRKLACQNLLKNLCKPVDVSKFGGASYPSKQTLMKLAETIEIKLNSYLGHRPDDYQKQLRSRLYNLRNNERLRFEVALDHIKPELLVKMKPEDMAPEELRRKREKMKEEAMENARSDWAVANYDKIQEQAGVSKDSRSMYECPKCRSGRIHSHAQQTRSADEPMTVFCQCLERDCGFKFRR